ncbi:MAG: DUF5011 domain-containing protein, partial [Planctomycetaceae bacterium]|nr:DUF5011 domain-containing protein [Planctomycetaceae bacterium]
MDTPITVNATYQRISLDGTSCTENCTVAEINFSQRSTYLLEYDAHDQAGNRAEQVVFALVLDDRIAPSITVAGGNAELVEFGSDWNLAESTALDNIDGNLAANIRYQVDNVTAGTVLGTDLTYAAAASLVTTSVVTDYMVTMTVSDQAGIYGQDSANNKSVAHKAVTVRQTVNVPPTLNEIPKQTVVEDSLEQAVNLGGITPGGIEVQPVKVTATSSKPDLIPDPEVTYNDGNATGTLKFQPVTDQHGTATITVTVEDGGLDNNLDTLEGNGTFSRTFQVDVTPVNDRPMITVLGDSNLMIEGLRAGQYSDAGATAWDVEDGDLTNDVSVSGDLVNLGKSGAYTLRYDVEDSAELAAAQQIRTVTVVDTLPPIITLRLDHQVIHISDHSQIGVGGVTNTDPGQPQLTNNTSVGNATKLANPVYRETTQKQPDGSDVRSRQDWTGRAAAGAVPDPELPTASAWDRLDTPITVNATYQRIDLDGTACTENCTVAEINFSQRSTYLLEYDAHDRTSNHAEQVVFALILDDRIAPSITVAGGNAETVEFGS